MNHVLWFVSVIPKSPGTFLARGCLQKIRIVTLSMRMMKEREKEREDDERERDRERR